MQRKELILGWILLFLVSIMYFFANLQKVVVPGSVFNELQMIFNCDAASITGLGAGFMYAYSINQLTVGVLADRYTGTRVIAVGGAFFCIGSLLSAYSGSLPLLYFSRVLTGFGASAVYLSMLKLIFRITPQAYTMVLGIMMLIGYSGSIISGAPFVKLIKNFGYSKCMLIIGIATAVCHILFVICAMMSKLPAINREVKLDLSSYKAVMTRHNLNVFLTTSIGFAIFYSMQMTIGKKFLEDFCQLSPEGSGIIMSIAMVISSCNAFLQAILTKLAGNRRLPFMHFCGFGCLAGSVILFLTTLFEWRCWQLPAGAWILLSFAGNNAIVQVAMLRETNPDNRVGTALSISNCIAYLVIAVAGSLTGFLLELYPPQLVDGIKIYGRNSYLCVFAMLVVFGLTTALNSIFLKETHGKNIKV